MINFLILYYAFSLVIGAGILMLDDKNTKEFVASIVVAILIAWLIVPFRLGQCIMATLQLLKS